MPELRGLLKSNDRGARVLCVLMHLFIVLEQANQRVAAKFCSLVTEAIV